MNIDLTKARPYAKAVFDIALRDKQLFEWKNTLDTLSSIAIECEKNFILKNPKISCKQKVDFFYEASKNPSAAANLVVLLAEEKKLELLQSIAFCYHQLFLEHDKTLEAIVIAAAELTSEQKEHLTDVLQKQYQHKVLLKCQVDNKLIAGIVINIAGQIVDCSLKNKLKQLKQNLSSREITC